MLELHLIYIIPVQTEKNNREREREGGECSRIQLDATLLNDAIIFK